MSILDTISAEIKSLEGTLGSNEKAKLDAHLDSISQLENKLNASMSSAGVCTKPATPGADSTYPVHGRPRRAGGQPDPPADHRQRLRLRHHAGGLPRVRQRSEADGQRAVSFSLPYDDQHGGYIHSGAASNYANLVKFEAYLATQFVSLINALKAIKDPLDSTGQSTLFDNTLMVWARDMGDAQNHNQQSMRFVLASGNAGYLKLASGGRYVKSTERHERILLNICDAFGITSFTGFGDPDAPDQDAAPQHRGVTRSDGLRTAARASTSGPRRARSRGGSSSQATGASAPGRPIEAIAGLSGPPRYRPGDEAATRAARLRFATSASAPSSNARLGPVGDDPPVSQLQPPLLAPSVVPPVPAVPAPPVPVPLPA